MNNFKKEGFRKGGSSFGGKPKFGGGNRFGGGDRGGDRAEREFFTTTCSKCHKSCEVPFRPNGEKPVYCKDCFGDKNSSETSYGRNDSRGGDFKRDARPSYRDERPARREDVRAPHTGGNDDLKRQVTNLEAKVDSILQLLKNQSAPKAETKAPVKVATVEKVAVPMVAEEAPKKARKPKTEVAKAKVPAKKKAAAKKAKAK